MREITNEEWMNHFKNKINYYLKSNNIYFCLTVAVNNKPYSRFDLISASRFGLLK